MITKLTGEKRLIYSNSLWDMYIGSYAGLGMQYNSIDDLFIESSTIFISFNSFNIPCTFLGFKDTLFGLKGIVMASDGSVDGKIACGKLLKLIDAPGHYAELSGVPRRMADKLKLTVIEAHKVSDILQKPVDISGAFVYSRYITGLGKSEKIMCGQPIYNYGQNHTI